MLRRLFFVLALLTTIATVSHAQENPVPNPPNPTPEVQKLLEEGSVAIKKSQWTQAIETLQRAQELAQKLKDVTGEASALNDSGVVYNYISQPQKALECYQKSLPLFRQTGDKSKEVNTLNNIGVAQRELGQYQKSLETLQQALPLSRQIKDQNGEANALANLGLVYSLTGHPQTALEHHQQALPLYRHQANKKGEANTLAVIGVVYMSIGQMDKALGYVEQSRALNRQRGDKNGEANALTNLGVIYESKRQSQKAAEYLQQAVPLFHQLGDVNAEATALINTGNIYANTKKYRKAEEFYRKALVLTQKTKFQNGEAILLNNIGFCDLRLGNFPQAMLSFQQALALFEQLGDKANIVEALHNFGLLFAKQKQPVKAIAYYERSLAVSEEIRSAIGGTAENRQQYLVMVLPLYREYTSLLLRQRQYTQAFAAIGKMKGRSLLEQATDKATLLGIPSGEQRTLPLLRQKCDTLSRAVMVAASRKNPQTSELKKQLAKAEHDLDNELNRLYALYPGSAQKNVAKTVTLADTAQLLLPNAALLEFVTLQDDDQASTTRTVLFLVTMEKGAPLLTVHSLSVKPLVLAPLSATFRQACAKPSQPYKSLARKLSRLLLPTDVLKRIATKTRLVVCPDGAVWNVPFAALVLPDGKHLLEAFEVDSAYSATGAQAALTVPQGKAEGMLVIANPDFGDTSRFGDTVPPQIAEGVERPLSDPARPISDPARFASILERGKIKSLPGTQREADALANLYPDATLLTGKDAQETTLTQELPKYRYLHFATHGLFSDAAPLQSAIVLAQPPKGSAEDGFLTAREISEMTLSAEMVVLSACETARGKNTEGEGVVGLTWALFAAGVPTQIVSQWKVSDASTPELMTAFYGNLKAGQGKGKALRNAALAMMHDGKHAHPYHWAAFVLFGDWR